MANLDRDYYLDKDGVQTLINELETNTIAEEYSTSATYAIGDYCIHDNKIYRCTTKITTAESWTSGHWTLVVIGDELKTKKSGTVTSVTIKGTSPITVDNESAITTSGTRTISLGTVPIANGGTGATTALDATDNLGVINWSVRGNQLQAGDNVDTLEYGKTYYCSTANISQTLTGTPPTTSSGFKIITLSNYNGNYDVQLAIATSTIFIRQESSNTWGDWQRLYTTGNLTSQSASSGGTTLSLVTTGEKYIWDNKPKKVDIANSTLLDYRRCVIALCRVSTTDDTFLNSYSAGTISFHRDNGLNGVAVIDFDIENNYHSAYSANVCSAYSNLQYADIPTVSKNKTWSWCSFKHNDIYYAGIEYYIADAMSHNIIVDYVGNFEPFAFAWYDTKNSAILDTEFSNSVSYTTPRHRRDEYFSERLYANKPINTFITGTGTAAEDKGSGVSPRFFPAIWTFDVKRTALNGDTVTIKVPVAGHDYGVYLSIDNGTNYYPIVTSGTSRLTTHYPVGSFVNLAFDDTGSASSMFPLNGGDSRATVTGGVWRVLNYYDSGNTKVTQSATNTNANYEILFSATADNTSRTEGAGKYSNLLFNPSTGNLQTTQLNGVTIGNSPKFTDTTYSAGNGMTLSGTTFKAGTRWEATTQGQIWSRLYLATPVVLTEGSSGLLNLTCTRGSVVCNATFLITTSHAGATYSTCQELASCNYTQIRSRLVVASNGTYYFEVYDTAQSIASGVAQKWHCCFIPLADTTLTCYTSFEDGSTIPSGYAEANDFTTTGGNTASAIKNITRSGTTFTATRQDGTTFTFTQQDNDTKNTAGSTDTTSKLFLIGATSQAANPQTYSDDRCYVTDGTLSANIISSYAGVYANTANSGTAGGLALYSTDPTRYGSTMRQTGSASGQLGKHGYVQGDWAIYYCMAQGTGAESRGWIFRGSTSGGNIASIDTGGNAVFNGSVTIGGNTTNTSGARMVYNSSTKAIDFVFV